MCLIAIEYGTYAAAPVLVAANREEFFARPWQAPSVQAGRPRVMCGIDETAGGTWLGINEFGVLVAVTNRPNLEPPANPRSRGTLCRELLNCPTARGASEMAEAELSRGHYAGANFLCADGADAWIVEHDHTVRMSQLEPGLHLLTNCDPDDDCDVRQIYFRELLAAAAPSSPAEFAAASRQILATPLDESGERTIVVRNAERGTVSSSVLGVGSDPAEAFYYFAPGAPDRVAYDDLTPMLASVLRRDD